MKSIRQVCIAVVLTCALTLTVSAGQITTGITEPPVPSPSSTTADGQITTGFAGQITTGSSEAVDPITQVALSLLQSVMSLF